MFPCVVGLALGQASMPNETLSYQVDVGSCQADACSMIMMGLRLQPTVNGLVWLEQKSWIDFEHGLARLGTRG